MLLTNPLLQATVPADSLKEPAAIIDQTIKTIMQTPVDQLISTGLEYALSLGVKILAAAVIYSIGAWLIRKIKNILRKIFERRQMDASLTSFILSFASITLSTLLIITTISVLGVDTTSFVALLAGSGLAVGMALSGTLQNFAGGIMLLIFKPFKVGDYIEALGYGGTVNAIEITSTHITTPDNKKIVLPNGALSNGTINNYSATGTRRCDWDFTIAYGTDIDKAKALALKIIRSHPAVILTPAEPFAALSSMGDSSIVLTCRAWTKGENYWTLLFDINEQIYKQFPENGIEFPFPQLDVNLKK